MSLIHISNWALILEAAHSHVISCKFIFYLLSGLILIDYQRNKKAGACQIYYHLIPIHVPP